MAEQPVLKTLDKALRILRFFDNDHQEWGIAELAREANIPKSTAYRILRVLEYHGLLAQDPNSRRFRLGLGALELGWHAYEGLELRRIAQPIMERIASESGETVLLSVLNTDQDRAVCIERIQQRSGLNLVLDVGATLPLHAGCTSKALLASLGEEKVEEVIARGLTAVTQHTITEPDQLRLELEKIRLAGYALSSEETDEGVAGVAVTVRDHFDRVIAALAISGPITRVGGKNIKQLTELAKDAASDMEAALGRPSSDVRARRRRQEPSQRSAARPPQAGNDQGSYSKPMTRAAL